MGIVDVNRLLNVNVKLPLVIGKGSHLATMTTTIAVLHHGCLNVPELVSNQLSIMVNPINAIRTLIAFARTSKTLT